MNSNTQVFTYFDTPHRSTITEIDKQKAIVNKFTIVENFFEALPNAAVLLDSNRQIVTFNKIAQSILTPDENNRIEGRRVGEAVNCIHAFDMPAGCGTSKFCEECGAGKCNKYTRENLKSCSSECRITTKYDDQESALDLRVSTSIIQLDEQNFTFFVIEDIKDEKRRKVLERIFFHDVLNTATAVLGISEIIKDSDSINEISEFKSMMFDSSNQLVKEIQSQRDIVNAEEGTLSINVENKKVNEILSNAFNIYRDHKLSTGKHYSCTFDKNDYSIKTDVVLLVRSLGNLIKNALEATDLNGNVKVFSEKEEGFIKFSVFNDKVIPDSIQLQIFQRSFSTKSKSGRGIGTYSVKLLVEQYLNGCVTFNSNIDTGTIFTIKLPIGL